MQVAATWSELRRSMKSGTELKGWSRDKGYTETVFCVEEINVNSIIVSSKTASQQRVIGMADFERIAAIWDAYRRGELNRGQIAKLSQNTTYIFGILKWLEEQR